MLDYTAVDFETANSYRGSPCSVGLIKVRNGIATDKRHWLIRPPEGVDWFDAWNTAIHGITAPMVAGASRWKDVLPAIVDFIGDDIVVAHNAGFDIGVIRYACAVDNIEWPEMKFLCTLVLSRRSLFLPTYRLPYVAEHLGFLLEDHHDALADANAVVEVVRRLADKQGAATLHDLAESARVRVGHMSSGIYRGSVSIASSNGHLVRPDINPLADRDGYLYGRVVVFTGKLMSMTRQIAWEECSKIGAVAEENTTKRTNVLVVGDINPAVLRPGTELTGRTRRAFDLQDAGQEIEVMTEDDFLRCLDGKALDDASSLLTDAETPSAETPSRLRSIPLADRPVTTTSKELKPPKPLRRTPVPTEQTCSIDTCDQRAAFKTRTKPTWCAMHIEEIQRIGGVRPLESFTHPDDWQLTECLRCSVQAHYRFNYTLDQNTQGFSTCRACFWRDWAAESRAHQGTWADLTPVPYDEAKGVADANGFDYLGVMPSQVVQPGDGCGLPDC